MKDFLEKLKVGDKIGHKSNYGRAIKTISRITKTMIILSNNTRYSIETGKIVGGHDWSTDNLIEITPEWEADLKRGIMRNKIRDYIKDGVTSKLSDTELKQIYFILKHKYETII